MTRPIPLTLAQREAVYFGKLQGLTLAALAAQQHCSLTCARKWWRVARDQGVAALRRPRRARAAPGVLSSFDPLVKERALYYKQLHPRRGPTRILADLAEDQALRGLRLPKPAQLALFFHQTAPELVQRHQTQPVAPLRPDCVHQLWQVDAKENIPLADGTRATVLDVREPLACACLGAYAHATQTAHGGRKLTLREIQADLRQAFSEFGLPEGIQTDRERVYGQPAAEGFPSLFSLWLIGLGIQHHFGRPGQATDQAPEERQHRTLFDWLAAPQSPANLAGLQASLARARRMHNQVLPSDAGDCAGRPPFVAHPEVVQPRRPYAPGAELTLFHLEVVDRFLAQYHWAGQVAGSGQVSVGGHLYAVGQRYAGQKVEVRFDPVDRHFVFTEAQTGAEWKRCAATGLDVATITGLAVPPLQTESIQLSFPW